MNPNNSGFGGFSSGLNSGTNFSGDIVVNSSSTPRRPIKKIIILLLSVVVAIAVIILLVVFLVIKPNQGDVSEVYSKLWSFYYDSSYQDLVTNYNAGVERMKLMQEGETPLIFPFTEGWITQTKQSLETVRTSYSDIENVKVGSLSSNQKKEFNDILKDTKSAMDTIESNVNTISSFYNAFIAPLNTLDEGKSLSCSKTEKISALISDSSTSDAANKYFTVYCEVIDDYSNIDDWEAFMDSISSQTMEASKSFGTLLKDVDSANEEKIKKLLSGLE